MFSREEKRALTAKFWDGFEQFCKKQDFIPQLGRKWILNRTNINGLDLKFNIGRNSAEVILETYTNRRLDIYEILEKYKVIVEEGFEDRLIWDFEHIDKQFNETCRIYTKIEGVDLHREVTWEKVYLFFAKDMMLLQTNFLEISDIIKGELRSR